MSADIIHIGHLNIIKEASKYGDLTVGVLTDKAVASYKRLPFLTYDTRSKTVESIKGVKKVIPQNTLDYTDNLIKLKPDYVVHGDDWKTGIQSEIRDKVIKTLNQWGGKLIEPSYTDGISSTMLNESLKDIRGSQFVSFLNFLYEGICIFISVFLKSLGFIFDRILTLDFCFKIFKNFESFIFFPPPIL